MKIETACKERSIDKYEIKTPILIPSFSSAFSPKISKLHNWISDYITSSSLVSSYDIYHKFIDPESIWVSDIVYIDSGTYEYEKLHNALNGKEWSPILHQEALDSLVPLTNAVLVNYDIKDSINLQIENASKFQKRNTQYAICFLCKPTNGYFNNDTINLLFEIPDSLDSFDILGFSEKELGNSLIERCNNIVRIRKKLELNNLRKPIHIFGCLDPLCVLSYYLCGADIFDGLSWLRYGYLNDVAIYPNNYSFYQKCWSDTDSEVLERIFIFNIEELRDLRDRMRTFVSGYDFSTLSQQLKLLDEVKNLTSQAGIEY